MAAVKNSTVTEESAIDVYAEERRREALMNGQHKGDLIDLKILLSVRTLWWLVATIVTIVAGGVGAYFGTYNALDKRVTAIEVEVTKAGCYARLGVLSRYLHESIRREDLEACEVMKVPK